MRMRFSPSTEQGPAMTWNWPPPILAPWPQSMTESSGWNLRFARLNGSETRCTRSTTSMDSSRNGSILVVSPTRPIIVSFSPRETSVFRPFFSIQLTIWLTASSLALCFRIAIMVCLSPRWITFAKTARIASRVYMVHESLYYPTRFCLLKWAVAPRLPRNCKAFSFILIARGALGYNAKRWPY